MDEIEVSDVDITMQASNMFNDILDKVRNSSLNFNIQMSPFTATISLKKLLAKDRSGAYIQPTFSYSMAPTPDKNLEMYMIKSENIKLRNEVNYLKESNQKLTSELDVIKRNIQGIEIDNEKKAKAAAKELAVKIDLVNEISKTNKNLIKEKSDILKDLQKLNDEMVNSKKDYIALENANKNDHKK